MRIDLANKEVNALGVRIVAVGFTRVPRKAKKRMKALAGRVGPLEVLMAMERALESKVRGTTDEI